MAARILVKLLPFIAAGIAVGSSGKLVSPFRCSPSFQNPTSFGANLSTRIPIHQWVCFNPPWEANPSDEWYLNVTELVSLTPRYDIAILNLEVTCRGPVPVRLNLWTDDQAAPRKDLITIVGLNNSCVVPLVSIDALGRTTDLIGIDLYGGARLSVGNGNETFHSLAGLRNVREVVMLHQDFHATFPRTLLEGNGTRIALLALFNCSLKAVPVHLLRKTMPHLQSLDVAGNLLSSPPEFPWDPSPVKLPRHTRRLTASMESTDFRLSIPADEQERYLILDDNRISNLSNHKFSGRLHALGLRGNGLQAISNSSFTNLTGVLYLNLSNNSLSHLPLGVFRTLRSLVALSLDFNRISHLSSDLFSETLHLKILFLNHNNLTTIPRGLLTRQIYLEELHLEDNAIAFISEGSFPDVKSNALRRVDLSGNSLRSIPVWMLLPHNLQHLNLSANMLTFESWREIFPHNSELRRIQSNSKTNDQPKPSIELKSNHFETISLRGLTDEDLLAFQTILGTFVMNMSKNLLNCHCDMLETRRWLRRLTEERDSGVQRTDFTTWKCSQPSYLSGEIVFDVEDKQFSRELESSGDCPEQCECYVRCIDKVVIVNCRAKNLTDFPEVLPGGVLEIHVEHNRIEVMPTLPYLGRITGLYLSNNKLERVNGSAFSGLTSITELYLDNNELSGLPRTIQNVNFTRLSLHNNFWKCDCHVKWLKDWLRNVTPRVQNIQGIRCAAGSAQGVALIDVPDGEFTCEQPGNTYRLYEKTAFRAVAFSLAALLVLTVVGLGLLYKFRGEVKLLLFRHFNWHPFDRLDDADPAKIYDAFVSYSYLDHDWVWGTLARRLEANDPPYKLCIHDRDFELGAPIAENILKSVEQSRRTILVLSRNFLASEWCLLEFQAAHRRALEQRMRYLIVILLEEVDPDQVNSEIKHYLRTNTYLSVQNRWFWPKLLYAMPQRGRRGLGNGRRRNGARPGGHNDGENGGDGIELGEIDAANQIADGAFADDVGLHRVRDAPA